MNVCLLLCILFVLFEFCIRTRRPELVPFVFRFQGNKLDFGSNISRFSFRSVMLCVKHLLNFAIQEYILFFPFSGRNLQ